MSLQKNYKKFQFTGKVVFGEKTFELNKVSKNEGKLEWTMNSANLCIEIENGNRVYPRLNGGFNADSKCYVSLKNEDGTMVDGQSVINFKDRFTHPDVKDINNVHDVSLVKVGLSRGDDEKLIVKSFISAYDAVEYVKETLKDGDVVVVRGDVKYQEYNGKTTSQYEIKQIFLSKAEPKDYKAVITQEVFFDKNILASKNEGTLVDLFGFVSEFNKEHTYVCYPVTIKFDTVKYPKWQLIVDNFLKPKSSTGLVAATLECEIKLADGTVDAKEVEVSSEVKALMEMGMWKAEDVETKLNGENREKYLVLDRISIDTKGNVLINKDGKASEIQLASDLLPQTESKKSTSTKTEAPAPKKSDSELDDLLAEMGV